SRDCSLPPITVSHRPALSPYTPLFRPPDPPGAPEADWCDTGHSIFILAGRIRYTFDDHVVEAGPGDMLHIPAGPAHRHKPRVIEIGRAHLLTPVTDPYPIPSSPSQKTH